MEELRASYRVSVFIGLAMMASLLVYLVVVVLIENGSIVMQLQTALPDRTREVLKVAFLGISLVVVLLVRPIARLLLTARAGTVTAGGNTAPLTTAAAVTYALCEVPAVLGLVFYFLARDLSDFYLFLIISLFAFSVHFPKFSQWEEWSRARRRQS